MPSHGRGRRFKSSPAYQEAPEKAGRQVGSQLLSGFFFRKYPFEIP